MPSRRSKVVALSFAAVVACGLIAAGAMELANDRQDTFDRVSAMTGGDPARGADVIKQYGCGACHQIPRIPQATAQVGPPLKGVSGRVYIAGRLTNTPENLVSWIRDPKAVDPLTAMPTLGLSEQEARDVAAYLYAH